jgi:hypothetical protein
VFAATILASQLATSEEWLHKNTTYSLGPLQSCLSS